MAHDSMFYAISLDPSGLRYQAFARRNAHLGSITIFQGIRGVEIPTSERVASGLMTPELVAAGTVTQGTVGCAASHRAVWRMIAASDTGAVIMEDDVLTHPDLRAYILANQALLKNADTVFFSVNTDSVLATVSAQGLQTSAIMTPRNPDVSWIENAFAHTTLADVKVERLLKGFGLCCYWVSPQGAAQLLKTCFPLTQEGTDIPFMRDKWPGSAIDGRMNAFFPSMRAYITRPFLAYSPNTDSQTSI